MTKKKLHVIIFANQMTETKFPHIFFKINGKYNITILLESLFLLQEKFELFVYILVPLSHLEIIQDCGKFWMCDNIIYHGTTRNDQDICILSEFYNTHRHLFPSDDLWLIYPLRYPLLENIHISEILEKYNNQALAFILKKRDFILPYTIPVLIQNEKCVFADFAPHHFMQISLLDGNYFKALFHFCYPWDVPYYKCVLWTPIEISPFCHETELYTIDNPQDVMIIETKILQKQMKEMSVEIQKLKNDIEHIVKKKV